MHVNGICRGTRHQKDASNGDSSPIIPKCFVSGNFSYYKNMQSIFININSSSKVTLDFSLILGAVSAHKQS